MVYLFKIVIFHGYVSHNQMVLSSKAHPNCPSYDVRCWCPRIPSSNLCKWLQCVHIFSKLNRRDFARNHCCGHASAPLTPHFVAKIPRMIGSLEICPQFTQNQQGVFVCECVRLATKMWRSVAKRQFASLPSVGFMTLAFDTKDPQSCFVNGMP